MLAQSPPSFPSSESNSFSSHPPPPLSLVSSPLPGLCSPKAAAYSKTSDGLGSDMHHHMKLIYGP